MTWIYFVVCALLFSLGDFVCSLQGPSGSKLLPAVFGASIGALGYLVFAGLSRNTPLAALAAYINGGVVLLSCIVFGYFIQGNRISSGEWFWIAVIFCGIVGLASSRSGGATPV
jgi:drug/metabolite transporter (DMT)-like permease